MADWDTVTVIGNRRGPGGGQNKENIHIILFEI